MKFKPDKHNRKSIRLKGYYSQPGWYFITICTQNREMFFGNVVNGKMVLNNAGKIVKECWFDIKHHYPDVALDKICDNAEPYPWYNWNYGKGRGSNFDPLQGKTNIKKLFLVQLEL